MLDLHVHLLGHQDRTATPQTIRAFLDRAREVGLKEIGFADHDLYWDELNLELIRDIAQEYPELQVRIGLEVDFRPQTERKIKEMLKQFPFDYVIGSVHEIKGWAFDHPAEIERYREKAGENLFREYFSLVEQLADAGLFTTIGHLDLVKIYGARPKSSVLEIANAALTKIKAKGLAIEINTNGRYKPVGEFYPGEELLQEIQRRQIPLTLGSDAHEAQFVGRDLKEVITFLQKLGITEIVSFEKMQPIPYEISTAS